MPTENLLLLHGALGSKQQMSSLAQALANDYSIHTLNFDGHGGKPSDTEFSMQLFAQNVSDYLQTNQIERTHIFGYSMGGYVALTLALSRPDLIGSIVTLGTKFDWTPETAKKEVRMLNPDVIEEKVPKFAAHLQAVHHPNDWKTVLQKTALLLSDLGNGMGLTDTQLSTIGVPVVIGIGDRDNMVTIDESADAARCLGNGKLEVLKGFYHVFEKNDMHELARFIQQQTSSII